MRTGTGTERDSQRGRNGTGNGEREGPARAGRAVGKGGKMLRWSGMCRSTEDYMRGRGTIRFGNYNIRNGWKGGMESALRGI